MLKELSKQDVLVCLDKLYKEGKRESIKRVFGRLSKLLKYAISREYIQTSAILNIDILSIYGKVQSAPFRAITDLKTFKELLCAIEAYQGSIFVLYALKISAHIFLRDSTIRNLKWEYIDFQNKQINIPASIIKGNEALKQIVQSIKEEAAVTKLKAQIADMEEKVEGFNGKEIYSYLIELNKTNPQMAQALDNPQGWEMIHKSLHAQNPAPQSQTPQQNTQPAPDFILNGTQDTKFEPNEVMSKIKNGTATYADMGKIFG